MCCHIYNNNIIAIVAHISVMSFVSEHQLLMLIALLKAIQNLPTMSPLHHQNCLMNDHLVLHQSSAIQSRRFMLSPFCSSSRRRYAFTGGWANNFTEFTHSNQQSFH